MSNFDSQRWSSPLFYRYNNMKKKKDFWKVKLVITSPKQLLDKRQELMESVTTVAKCPKTEFSTLHLCDTFICLRYDILSVTSVNMQPMIFFNFIFWCFCFSHLLIVPSDKTNQFSTINLYIYIPLAWAS